MLASFILTQTNDMFPQFDITYANGITQLLSLIPQAFFDMFRDVKAEYDKDIEGSPGTQNLMSAYQWIGDLMKSGKACTTESPIGKTIVSYTNKLVLPEHQGGTNGTEN